MPGWLHAKLALVLGLAALHGVISGQMRRAAVQPGHVVPRWFAALPALLIVGLGAIAVLVVTKPG